jgi:hypothetical protein
MAGYALFALKAPSLLSFDDQRQADAFNLTSLFGFQHIPSDTQMRTILDEIDPAALRPAFTSVFRELQRGKALEPFVFFQGHYLLAVDGVGYFSSEKIKCPSCLEKKSRNGAIAYSHQMLAAVLVHPDHPEVIPVCPEPIIKQDGSAKNDCERNASRRFFEHFRHEHPRLPVIVIEDALGANAPHVADLQEHNLRFILGIKPGSHACLFAQMETAVAAGLVHVLTLVDAKGVLHHYRWLGHAALNESRPDIKVTMLEYWEIHPTGKSHHFSWITDLAVAADAVATLAAGGRCRWHVENETFNTLKNQGYHFDHNFGHGHKNLSVVFALLLMLAFLVDQTMQLCDVLFQAVWAALRRKCRLWEAIRSAFYWVHVTSLRHLYELLLAKFTRSPSGNSS